MNNIKLDLSNVVKKSEDIKPEAGMIIECNWYSDRKYKRLIVSVDGGFAAIDLESMNIADDSEPLDCLMADASPKILGKLTL